MAKKPVPKKERSQPPLAAFGALVVLVVVITLGARGSDRVSTHSYASARTRESVGHVFTPTGWDLADALLVRRDRYRRASGADGFPEWEEYTDAYFRELAARRASVIAWVTTQPEPPAVVFVGSIHADMGGATSPEHMEEIRQMQERVFERLRMHAEEASVIAIEDACDEGVVLTPEIFAEMGRNAIESYYGLDVSSQELLGEMRQSRDPGARAILELETPVICGEEWPLQLETRLRMRGPPGDPVRAEILGEYIDRSVWLRTDIILIRTLEHLRRVNGSRAVIVQGDVHRQMAESLADQYHIVLTGIPVD